MILDHLKQPEYVHVIINHLPLYGMAIGAALLAAALPRKSVDLRVAALALIALAGAAAWVVGRAGRMGYDRVLAMSGEDAQLWLRVHENRAEKAQYGFYLTALLAIAALEALRKGKKTAVRLCVLACLGAGICAAMAGWINQAGGQVRHSEFRDGPPRPAEDLGVR